jgi:hypothetical protein
MNEILIFSVVPKYFFRHILKGFVSYVYVVILFFILLQRHEYILSFLNVSFYTTLLSSN